jgi:hypothetical protein|tara:strand:- start:910 stop:1128 length:219 start_codon:yes stop_codon:yes gene_type:complete
MILAEKCPLSQNSCQRCEFARTIQDETHCVLILEWFPDDTRVVNLKKCMVKMLFRDRLSFRNAMLRKNAVQK